MAKVPFPKQRPIWPAIIAPFTMGFFYLAIAYPRFCDDFSFIWEHLFILVCWLMGTIILMFAVREVLLRMRLRLTFIPAVIIPTVSCFLLYVIYVSAAIGNLSWGSTPTYKQVLRFIPHFFNLMDDFEIPRGLIVAFVAIPLVALALIFQGRVREMIIWHWVLRETFVLMGRRHQRIVVITALAAWVAAAALILSADPSINQFGNFSHDPVITFFKLQSRLFQMTQERVFWVQRDLKARKTLRRRKPKVHNVFLIVVDALRADYLPLYGYPRPLTPFLSAFLPEANMRKVDWGLSNALETRTGLLCLLTSKEPKTVSHLNYTLPDFFADEGFEVTFILAGDHHWQEENKAFGQKVDLFYDGSDYPGPTGICDDDLVVNKVAGLKPDDGNDHFFYIHLISVHQAGTLEQKYMRYLPVRAFFDPKFRIDYQKTEGDIQEIRNMYDDRILQMDGKLRAILSLFKKKGYLKDYVAVLTADHGQLLGEKNQFGHGYYASIGAIHVPMVFFGSNPLPSFPQSQFAVQIDIAPTLADMVFQDFPFSWQGQSLLRKRTNPWSYHLSPSSRPDQEGAVVYYDSGRILKFDRRLQESADDKGQLFNLEKDPEEKMDLIEKFDPQFLNEIRAQAHEHFTIY